jgi:hypothetical protein
MKEFFLMRKIVNGFYGLHFVVLLLFKLKFTFFQKRKFLILIGKSKNYSHIVHQLDVNFKIQFSKLLGLLLCELILIFAL